MSTCASRARNPAGISFRSPGVLLPGDPARLLEEQLPAFTHLLARLIAAGYLTLDSAKVMVTC